MERIRDFLIITLIGLFLLLLQQSGLASFLGVRANLILIFFVFYAVTRRHLYEYALLLLLLLGFFFSTAEVWFFDFVFFSFLSLFLFFVRPQLPGRFFFDFFILIILGTLGTFFGLPVFRQFIAHGFNFSELIFPRYGNLFLEMILNIFVGLFFVFVGTRRFLSRIFS